MEKYKKVIINLAILTFLLSAGATTAYANPDEYNDNSDTDIYKRARVLETFENGDYAAWKRTMRRQGGYIDFVNKEQFDKFIQARKLARSGKYSEAVVLGEELEIEIKKIEKFFINEKIDKNAGSKNAVLDLEAKLLKKKLKKIT